MLDRIGVVSLSAAAFVLATVAGAGAGEQTGRSYSHSSASTTSEQSVEVWHGQRRSTTTWTPSSARRSDALVKTTWDPEPRKKPDPAEASDDAVAADTSDGAADESTTPKSP